MKDETKQEILIKLEFLKKTIVQNRVSMGMDKDGNLMFFDTDAYIKSKGKKFDGFKVNINDLVR